MLPCEERKLDTEDKYKGKPSLKCSRRKIKSGIGAIKPSLLVKKV
jgi:hypothetical protein